MGPLSMIGRGALLLLVFLVATLSSGVARANGNEAAAAAMDDAANAFWDQAEALSDLEAKREAFVSAARAYEEAHRLDPRFERIRSAASAWKNAGDDARAADDLELALGQSPPEADRTETERLLGRLDATLARVTLRFASGTRVLVDDRTFDVPSTLRRPPGRLVARATLSDGTRVDRTVDLAAGDRTTIDFAPTAPRRNDSRRLAPPADAATERTPPAGTIVGATLLGVGSAGLVATAVLAGFGYAADDDAERAGPGSSSIQDAIDLQRAAWGVGVPSAALGVAGLVVLLVDAGSSHGEARSALPCAGGSPASIVVCGRF